MRRTVLVHLVLGLLLYSANGFSMFLAPRARQAISSRKFWTPSAHAIKNIYIREWEKGGNVKIGGLFLPCQSRDVAELIQTVPNINALTLEFKDIKLHVTKNIFESLAANNTIKALVIRPEVNELDPYRYNWRHQLFPEFTKLLAETLNKNLTIKYLNLDMYYLEDEAVDLITKLLIGPNSLEEISFKTNDAGVDLLLDLIEKINFHNSRNIIRILELAPKSPRAVLGRKMTISRGDKIDLFDYNEYQKMLKE